MIAKKITAIKFFCEGCNKKHVIRCNGLGVVPTYAQCIQCKNMYRMHTEFLWTHANICVMNKEDTEKALQMEEQYKSTGCPLKIFRMDK